MLYDPKWQKPEETTTEEWRIIVGKAADLIENSDWVQHRYKEETEIVLRKGFFGWGRKIKYEYSYCVVGAIREVVGADEWDVAEKLAKVLKVPSIPDWNDAPERTKAEVIHALRAVARGEV